MIEKYVYTESGYSPLLINEGWQVAQLNCLPRHRLDDIDQIEVHRNTDEVFVLMEGVGVLMAAEVSEDGKISYEMVNMVPGVTYNIPCGTWHNIAMNKDAKIIIVERDNTHLKDCAYIDLTREQQDEVRELIKKTL